MESVVKRKGSGRRKIDIKKIQNKSYLQVTFSKRRAGLFKKAAELGALCGVDVAVIVQSPAGKIFASGGQSTVNSIIDRYLATSLSSSNNADQFQQVGGGGQEDNQDEKKHVEIMKEIEVEKVKEKAIMESTKGGKGFWWEGPFDDLDVNELEEHITDMEGLRKNVLAKAEEMARANKAASSIVES